MQHNDGYAESIFSYVNNIPTTEGGTHETGFKTALTKVMNDFCRRTGVLKDKDASLTGEDFREGITAVLSLKMRSIQFEGQTKTRLGNTEARPAVEAVVGEALARHLEDLKNAAAGAGGHVFHHHAFAQISVGRHVHAGAAVGQEFRLAGAALGIAAAQRNAAQGGNVAEAALLLSGQGRKPHHVARVGREGPAVGVPRQLRGVVIRALQDGAVGILPGLAAILFRAGELGSLRAGKAAVHADRP